MTATLERIDAVARKVQFCFRQQNKESV